MKRARNLTVAGLILILAVSVWRGCQNTPGRTVSPMSSKHSARPSGNIDPKSIKEPETKEEYEAVVKEKSIEFAKRNNAPIAFYGRVVDQDGKPLQGVEVDFHVTAIPTIPVPWGPDETKNGSCVTDQNGLFLVEGKRGISLGVSSLRKSGYRESGYYQQGHARYEPYSSQRHIPNRDKPVEFMLIRDDLPQAEKVYGKILSFVWNSEPVVINCGNLVGSVKLTPTRRGMNPANKLQTFDWSVDISSSEFGMARLEGNGTKVAPIVGYQSNYHYDYSHDSANWKMRVVSFLAVHTKDDKYGVMELQLFGDGEDNGVCGNATIYLNKSGSRNIDHK